MLAAVIFTGCSANSKVVSGDAKSQRVEVTKNIGRSTPEETVKTYYSSEVSKDSQALSEYFISPQMSDIDSIKKKIDAFSVDKMELIKLFNVKKQGDYAVMVSSFNTYFKNVQKPRSDAEVVALVNKNGSWYILNDYGGISDKDMDWLNAAKLEENQFLAQNSDIQAIIKENEAFDKDNSVLIAKGKKAMMEMQNSNNSF